MQCQPSRTNKHLHCPVAGTISGHSIMPGRDHWCVWHQCWAQWRHTSVSTHHLQQFAVYLLHLDCTQQPAAQGGAGQMTQSCTNCLQGAGQPGGSSIHHQRLSSTRRGGEDIFAPQYPRLHNIFRSDRISSVYIVSNV